MIKPPTAQIVVAAVLLSIGTCVSLAQQVNQGVGLSVGSIDRQVHANVTGQAASQKSSRAQSPTASSTWAPSAASAQTVSGRANSGSNQAFSGQTTIAPAKSPVWSNPKSAGTNAPEHRMVRNDGGGSPASSRFEPTDGRFGGTPLSTEVSRPSARHSHVASSAGKQSPKSHSTNRRTKAGKLPANGGQGRHRVKP